MAQHRHKPSLALFRLHSWIGGVVMTAEVWAIIGTFFLGALFAIVAFLYRQTISDIRNHVNKIEDILEDHVKESVGIRDRLTKVETTVNNCPTCSRRD